MMYNPCPQIIIYLLGLCVATHYKCDNEMTPQQKKKKKVYIWKLCYFQIYIYRIQIVQTIIELSSKIRFNQSSLFLIY
jgi:hypothetical protein